MKSILVTVTLCISFLINSLMFGWEATRRSGDEIMKINSSSLVDVDAREDACIRADGVPSYFRGKFQDCSEKKY